MNNFFDNELKYKLYDNLLEASKAEQSVFIHSLLHAISQSLPNSLCSIWLIDNNTKTLSLLDFDNYQPVSENKNEFVHEIEGSLIGYMLEKFKVCGDKRYCDIDNIQEEKYLKLHKCPQRVLETDSRYLVGIPIKIVNFQSEENQYHAIVNIYFKYKIEFNDEIATIIRSFLSISLYRYFVQKEEFLSQEIKEIYRNKGNKDLASTLHPIISTVLKKYLNYEGGSIFIWDSLISKLVLLQTTGIRGNPTKADVQYSIGEGITGRVAATRKPEIIHDLTSIGPELLIDHVGNWEEKTEHQSRSLLFFPILSPSNRDEIVGVIRLINKKNIFGNTIDYFNELDIRLIGHISEYLSLYFDNFINSKVKIAFANQLAHEILTPAVGIRGTVSRYLRKFDEPNFLQTYAKSYLRSILDQSKLQIALTHSIQYLWKGDSSTPRCKKYQVIKYDIQTIINNSKKLVIPILRTEKLQIDNIFIKGIFPVLFVDPYAIESVFFNLFTNAIKYREVNRPDTFNIVVEGFGLGEQHVIREKDYQIQKGLLIKISDSGIGIDDRESTKIFLLGYRKKGIEKTNVRGLGIGLTVVKRVLNDFDCKIWVSNLRYPTEFTIFIPEKLLNGEYTKQTDWNT